jgi:hypothetical protein
MRAVLSLRKNDSRRLILPALILALVAACTSTAWCNPMNVVISGQSTTEPFTLVLKYNSDNASVVDLGPLGYYDARTVYTPVITAS